MKHWKWMNKKQEPVIKEVVKEVVKEVPIKPPDVKLLYNDQDAEEHIAHLEEYILTLEQERDKLKKELDDAQSKTNNEYIVHKEYYRRMYDTAFTGGAIHIPRTFTIDEASVPGESVQSFIRARG